MVNVKRIQINLCINVELFVLYRVVLANTPLLALDEVLNFIKINFIFGFELIPVR